MPDIALRPVHRPTDPRAPRRRSLRACPWRLGTRCLSPSASP